MKDSPLIVWVYTSLILIFIIVLTLLFPKKEINENLDIKPLLEPYSNFRVVSIGTSLTGTAFYPDKKMEIIAKEKNNITINYFRFAKPGRNLETFSELFENLKNSKVDLILIEDNLLYYKDKPYNKFDEIKNTITDWILSKNTANVSNYEEAVEITFKKYDLQKQKVYYNKVANNDRFKREFYPTPELHDLLEYAKNNNIKIALIELPFAKEVEEHFSQELKLYEQNIRNQYKEKYNIEYIPFNEEIDASYFGDGVHSNRKGREFLSSWLINQVKEELIK